MCFHVCSEGGSESPAILMWLCNIRSLIHCKRLKLAFNEHDSGFIVVNPAEALWCVRAGDWQHESAGMTECDVPNKVLGGCASQRRALNDDPQ